MRTEPDGVVAHLGKVLMLIDDDLVLSLEAHESHNRGGFFGVSRQVFCYFDYLGALAYGSSKGTTKDAVRFMETYLAKANDAYAGKCALMYHMWRHGTVHELDPKVYVSESKSFELRWMANNSSAAHNRKWHMQCLCRRDKPSVYQWNINLFQLVDDLRASILLFLSDLQLDPEKLSRAQDNYDSLSAPENLDASSKADLLGQAEVVVQEASGAVDENGNVESTFDTPQDLADFLSTWETGLTQPAD